MANLVQVVTQKTFEKEINVFDEKINKKVDKVDGKGLSDQNFTLTEKQKLESLHNYDDSVVNNRIKSVEDKIPTQASTTNQLADKDFVNSSIQTYTAYFDGSWNTYADIPETVEGFTELGFVEPSPNNYLVIVKDENNNNETWRYKYTGDFTDTYTKSLWKAEYRLNNTSFTEEQLKALNSGVTNEKVAQIGENEAAIISLSAVKENKDSLKDLAYKTTIDNSDLISNDVVKNSHIVDGQISESKLNSELKEKINATESDPVFTSWKNGEAIVAGNNASGSNFSVIIGKNAKSLNYTVAIGLSANSSNGGDNVVIGRDSKATFTKYSGGNAVAIGRGSEVAQPGSAQICIGTNNIENSLQFRNTQIVNGSGSVNSLNNYYLHNEKFYSTRTGSGTEQSPYVYSDEIELSTSVIYLDKESQKLYRYNGTNIIEITGGGSSAETDPLFTAWKDTSTSISIGKNTNTSTNCVSIGEDAKSYSSNSIAIGKSTQNNNGQNSIAIGPSASTNTESAIAIGSNAKVGTGAVGACQIGYSATPNNNTKSLRFRDTEIVNSNGKIVSSNLDVDILSKIEEMKAVEAALAEKIAELESRLNALS